MASEQDFLKTFCKISKAFGTISSPENLLDLIVDSAVETMQAKAACLFLADEEKNVFVPAAQTGLSDNYLHAKPLQAKKIVNAILKGGYLYIEDATTDPRLEHHDLKKAEGIVSILDVPVMMHGKAIGVLALYTDKKKKFSRQEIEFLSAMAEQGAMALEKARLLQRIEENTRLFLKLARNINSSLDIKQILDTLSADVCNALKLKGVTIRLLDRSDSDNLRLVASYGLNEKFINKGPIRASVMAEAVLQGETVIIENATEDDRVRYPKAMKAEGIVSVVVAPIRSKDSIIGTLTLYTSRRRKFFPESLMLIEALAQHGGFAIHNASLYLQLQEDKKNLEKDIWSHRSWF